MSKNLVLIRDVINLYHPEFVSSRSLRNYALKNPEIFKVERLVEECLAHVGPYKFIDGEHMDYDDFSDSKTASISPNPTKKGGISHRGEISGVETAGGGRKAGALRCTIYNPHKNDLKYYFLPKSMWAKHITIHPSSGVGKIIFSYNSEYDGIPTFQGFECRDFRELALAH